MARLDTVKNITGLTEWYGENKRLQSLVNLVDVASFFDPSKSKDGEEMAEIKRMHLLIEQYQLKGQIRLIVAQTDSSNKIADFFQKCKEDIGYWNIISDGGLRRIYECYTWKIYANKVLNMGNIYSFWKQLNKEQKEAKQRYIELFYNLHYKSLVRTVLIASDEAQSTPVSRAKPATQATPRIYFLPTILPSLLRHQVGSVLHNMAWDSTCNIMFNAYATDLAAAIKSFKSVWC